MSLRDAIAATRVRVKRPKERTLSEVPMLNGTVAYVAERFPETASIPPVEQLFEVADRLGTQPKPATGPDFQDVTFDAHHYAFG